MHYAGLFFSSPCIRFSYLEQYLVLVESLGTRSWLHCTETNLANDSESENSTTSNMGCKQLLPAPCWDSTVHRRIEQHRLKCGGWSCRALRLYWVWNSLAHLHNSSSHGTPQIPTDDAILDPVILWIRRSRIQSPVHPSLFLLLHTNLGNFGMRLGLISQQTTLWCKIFEAAGWPNSVESDSLPNILECGN